MNACFPRVLIFNVDVFILPCFRLYKANWKAVLIKCDVRRKNYNTKNWSHRNRYSALSLLAGLFVYFLQVKELMCFLFPLGCFGCKEQPTPLLVGINNKEVYYLTKPEVCR